MDPALVIWFVITLQIGEDHPVTFIDEKVSSIEVCLVRATNALRDFAKVKAEDGWEVSVKCNLVKPEEKGG